MNTNNVESIFFSALKISSPNERAAYLDEACGQDRNLRKRVEMLLEAQPEVGSFMEQPAVDRDVTLDLRGIQEGPGAMIGPYKLLQQIGVGGFGVVYMAQQQEPIKRRVALKIIKLGMDTKQAVGRFEAERQALALMDHPNIARVLDAGSTESGRPYFVMELVRGFPITEFCDENKLTMQERLELFIPVCQAIQHAHQKAIIHRDIKPSNVLVTMHDDKAVPKVIDFGIAKATQAELTTKTIFTQFQQFIGTPAYMSPEQAQMSGLDIDTRCDVYALGVLLYELLTGSPPFDPDELKQGGYDEIRRRIREEEPPKPSSRVSTTDAASRASLAKSRRTDADQFGRLLRGDLDWIIMKAMEKDRTRRYETANGLALDVKRFLSHEPVSAAAPSVYYRLQKFVQRNRAAVITATAFALVLILGTVISSWQALVATRQQARAESAEQRWQEEAEQAIQARNRLRREAYAADMKSAQVALDRNNRGQAVGLLSRYRPQAEDEDLRGIEWRYLLQRTQGDEIHSWTHPSMTPSALFSPDGRFVVSGCSDKHLRVWEVASHRLVKKIYCGVRDRVARGSFCFSPDGYVLATEHEDGVVLLDCTNWQVQDTLPLPPAVIHAGDTFEPLEPVRALKYSPDGKLLVATAQAGIIIWNTASRQRTFLETESNLSKMAFMPDSTRLAVRSGLDRVDLWDLAAKTKVQTFHTKKGCFSVAVSPQGQWLAAGALDGHIELWNLDKGRSVWTHQVHLSRLAALAFSPDGQLLATGGYDQLIHLWNVNTKEIVTTLRGHHNEVWSLEFAPDGETLISSGKDGTVKLWSTKPTANPHQWWLDSAGHPLGFDVKQQRLITITNNRDAFEHWNRDRLQKRVPIEPPLSREQYDDSLVSLKSSILCVLDQDSTVQCYNFETGKPARSLKLRDTVLSLTSLSPDERWLAGIARTETQQEDLCIWDFNSGERTLRISDYNPLIKQLSRNQNVGVGFSSDGRLMAYGDAAYVVKVWDLAKARLLWSLSGHTDHVLSFDFSADGKLLASGGWGDNVRIWDLATGKPSIPPLRGHGSGATPWFSPDGKSLFTDGDDATVRVWHVPTGREMILLEDVRAAFGQSAIFLSPSGRLLALRETDGQVRIERIPSLQEIESQ